MVVADEPGRERVLGRILFVDDEPSNIELFQLQFDDRFEIVTALNAAEVYPRRHQDKLPIWLGVAGTPQSFMRVGTLGLPLMIAIICGTFDRFRPLVDLYLEADHSPYMLKVGTVFDDTKMSTALLDCLPTASTYSKLATTASASRPAQLRHPLQRKRRRQHTT